MHLHNYPKILLIRYLCKTLNISFDIPQAYGMCDNLAKTTKKQKTFVVEHTIIYNAEF